MNKWQKPVLINMSIVVALLLFDLATGTSGRNGMSGPFATSGILIMLLAPINLITGMVRNRNRKSDGPVYLLLSGLLLLVGFSVCTIQ